MSSNNFCLFLIVVMMKKYEIVFTQTARVALESMSTSNQQIVAERLSYYSNNPLDSDSNILKKENLPDGQLLYILRINASIRVVFKIQKSTMLILNIRNGKWEK